ncbi:alpha-mannosidase [Ruania halotolerans]|uniref:alpha-mannosidase n=1 Tax=Ruania halotolerans TaxID=2897773 RepID=UPI001E565110|nr:glycoside hydrolase family 38 C-terminal domain-containing protein [Ruania halotolerans]UFU08165.1 glycosyl hydrolase-related protein [Ruania halotolerans]
MHRTITDIGARLDRALAERIAPAVHSHRAPVTVEANVLPGEPVSFAEAVAGPFAPFEVGTPWGRPWGTTWFRITGVVNAIVSAHAHEQRIELLVDLGFGSGGPGFRSEALAYTADGTILKAVEPRTAYVPVGGQHGAPITADGAFEIYLEAASNPRFDGTISAWGDLTTAGEELLYRLERAELALREPEVHQLLVEARLLHEIAATTPETDPRHHELRGALDRMVDELDASGFDRVVESAPAARAQLSGVLADRARTSAHTISAVGHAHIDSAWLWPVRETIRKCSRTFSNVVALAREYPEFIFACSSAQQYAWMRDHHPQVWEQIRAAVDAGQFVPVGGMWVESDTNLPGGESLVRQFTAGKRFFAEHFGTEAREVWLPDSFGYSGALPQLARLAGFDWFLSQKMSWNSTNAFPHHTFWWEGIDGTRVFTHFPPSETYSSEFNGKELARSTTSFRENGLATRSLMPFGYGDGGGGPTREMLETARLLADLDGAPRVQIETPEAFFTAAHAEYGERAPVWSGEMYLEFHRGTYTSQRAMKEGNRRTEHLLHEAELWSATAAVRRGAPYPAEELQRIWEEVLLLQFHDILPGSSIAWVHREARERYTALTARLESLIETALDVLGGPGEVPLAFNATPHPCDGVPAHGAAPRRRDTTAVEIVEADGEVYLDNALLRVRIGTDGTLASVWDHRAGREVLAGPGNALWVHPDTPNRFDAWDLDEFYRHSGHPLTTVDHLELDTSDPARPVVRITRSDGESTYVQHLALAAGSMAIECAAEVDWHERERILKVAFPLAVHARESTAETQFGYVQRPTHTNTSWDAAKFEIPAHKWLHVGEPGYGIAVTNETTYGHEATRPGPGDAHGAGATTVRLSLLRAPRYPDPQTDQGHHILRYQLVCGADVPEAIEAGYRTARPLRERCGGAPVEPVVRMSEGTDNSPSHGVLLETVKLADDGSGDLVLRLYESRGGRGRAELHVCEGVQMRGAAVTDLLERSDEAIAALAPLHRDGNRLTVDMAPFQVVTVRITRAAPMTSAQKDEWS